SDVLKSNYQAQKIAFDGSKDAALAGLFLSALHGNIENLTLRDAPVSYLFDNRETVDYYSMSVHVPGFLKWGDVSLVAALAGSSITFIDPRTMSGQEVNGKKLQNYRVEYNETGALYGKQQKVLFNH